MRSFLLLFGALVALSASTSHAQLHRWVGDAGDNFLDFSWQTASSEDSNNPGPRTLPGPNDLAIVNNTGFNGSGGGMPLPSPAPTLQIDSNITLRSLRLSNGGSVNHTAGTLTFNNLAGNNDSLWVGEFGPATSDYTLDGGTISVLETANPGFQVGRGGPADFTFNSGTINATDTFTSIGFDATANWTQTSGVLNGKRLDIGRFQSPTATANLSGDATWNISDGLLIADGSTNFAGALSADLNITGSSVGVQANALIVREKGNLAFTADASGVSPIVQTGNGLFLIQSADGLSFPGLSVDLTAYTPTTDVVTLIDGFRPSTGQFDGLAEGSAVPNSGGRVITYVGGDGFDVSLVPLADYVAPNPNAPTPDAAIARWSMDPNPNAPGPFISGNAKFLDSRVGVDEGTISVRSDAPAVNDDLFFLSADNNATPVTSTDVPPISMFANGNDAGLNSYDAGLSIPSAASEGALFFPQDVYGDEFSFTESFSLEAFFKTSEGVNDQQILLQGTGFARYGLTMNVDDGGLRFFVNDGSSIEFVEIGGSTGEGSATYADDEWHYVLATFEADAGVNGAGQLTLAIADEDGSTSIVTQDLPNTFLGLPDSNDGNLFIGVEDFNLADGPRRFDGLIDEIQISAGIVPESDRLGFLDLGGLPGDFNNDGLVDGADYAVWRNNFGTANDLGGNGDESGLSAGVVDQADLALWRDNFGNTSIATASSSVAAPEPGAAIMLLIAAFALSMRRH